MAAYPYTIDNGHGEVITFTGKAKRNNEEYVLVENNVHPNSGPPMHVHFFQDENLTVVSGTMTVHIQGSEPYEVHAGQSASFKRGEMHRFWNSGKELLICKGDVYPAHNFEYFISQIFRSAKAHGKGRPGQFDAAYLLTHYRSEYDMDEIPAFVKKNIFPLIVFFGKLRGKHMKFAGAPPAVVK